MQFDKSKIKPGDIIAVRRINSDFAYLIRTVLGSYTNHNAMLVRDDGGWWVGEAISPKSQLTPFYEYEGSPFIRVRVWRIPNISDNQREAINQYFLDHMLGLPYPFSVVRLWVFRIVNKLPWKIEGQWCTRIVRESCEAIVPDILGRLDGREKKNFTPRTMENRLIAGILKDVTDEVIV